MLDLYKSYKARVLKLELENRQLQSKIKELESALRRNKLNTDRN